MIYKAKNIDTDKFLEEINNLQKYSLQKETREREQIQKYHEGYRKALDNIESMFYCSNYEKKVEVSNVK